LSFDFAKAGLLGSDFMMQTLARPAAIWNLAFGRQLKYYGDDQMTWTPVGPAHMVGKATTKHRLKKGMKGWSHCM
jgi:hypothetical protein